MSKAAESHDRALGASSRDVGVGSERRPSDIMKRYKWFGPLSELARRVGLHVYDRDLLWFCDVEFLELWRRFPETTPTIWDRRFSLFSAAQSVRNLPGDTAECGVFRGAASFLILGTATQMPNKTHHVFDSFEGLSKPGTRDQPSENLPSFMWREHDFAAGEDVVAGNLAEFKNFRLYRGWIPSRFAEVAEHRFSFVHIDVDLYQPTLDSMAFFYSRMTPGGIIMCDDYGFVTCPGAKRAVDDFLADKPESVIQLTSGQGMLVKQ